MTAPVIQAVQFEAPLVNPSPNGLYAATSWTDETAPNRWLAEGVVIRPHNYGGEGSFGIWTADWCAQPDDLTEDDIKTGTRPGVPDGFDPLVAWAYDECDMTPASQTEVQTRVQQNLRLMEQVAIEREFATRALADATALTTATSLVAAVGAIEAEFAKTNTVGFIHASPALAAPLADANQLVRSGSSLKTVLGHTWVFGGGYVAGLGTQLVATSPTYGWRSEVTVRPTFEVKHNVYAAIAERAVVVGYETAIAKVDTSTAEPGGGA